MLSEYWVLKFTILKYHSKTTNFSHELHTIVMHVMKFGLVAHVIQGSLNIFTTLGESVIAECIYAVVAVLIIMVYVFSAVDPLGYR